MNAIWANKCSCGEKSSGLAWWPAASHSAAAFASAHSGEGHHVEADMERHQEMRRNIERDREFAAAVRRSGRRLTPELARRVHRESE